jgi:hypothetical protein
MTASLSNCTAVHKDRNSKPKRAVCVNQTLLARRPLAEAYTSDETAQNSARP